MSDKISRAELFDKLATITAEDANDMKAKIYAVIQEMPTDPEPRVDIDWTELYDDLSRGMARMNLAIRSASAGMAESIRTAITLREPKRGEWRSGDCHGGVCSECKDYTPFPTAMPYRFCPNCGADMREREAGQ